MKRIPGMPRESPKLSRTSRDPTGTPRAPRGRFCDPCAWPWDSPDDPGHPRKPQNLRPGTDAFQSAPPGRLKNRCFFEACENTIYFAARFDAAQMPICQHNQIRLRIAIGEISETNVLCFLMSRSLADMSHCSANS